MAYVTPVYKKGSRTNPSNYRPISLPCICCKLLEHIIYSAISSHANVHNIMCTNQHGFRKKRSCETQLLETINDLTGALDAGYEADILFLDFSKAFDRVSHNCLLYRIHRIIDGVLILAIWQIADKPPNLNSPFILIVVVIRICAAYGIVEVCNRKENLPQGAKIMNIIDYIMISAILDGELYFCHAHF